MYSKNEHLMVFRRSYKGPLSFEKGEHVWTKVRSIHHRNTECFVFVLNEYHLCFERLAQEYKIMYEQEWDGSYVVPCGYVQFSDSELERKLRPEWEQTKEELKRQMEDRNDDC